MAAQAYEPLEAAARYAVNLYEALKASKASIKDDGRLEAQGLYTRARQFPSLLAQAGLLPVTAFALAKTEDLRAVDEAFQALGGGQGSYEKLLKDSAKSGGGYAVMAGLVARVLADNGKCQQQGPVAVWLSKCLVNLSEKGGLLALEALVLTVMQEFKKYIEAFVAKPKREE